MSLLVLDPGLASRIVDLGRPRTRSLGVPVGGAADRRSLMLGNSLLGNPPDSPALEIALKGPRLRADANIAAVLFGAPFEMECAGVSQRMGRTFTLHPGEELTVLGTPALARAYLCVQGGFEAPTILASRSGLNPIRAGETLTCASSAISARCCLDLEDILPMERPLRVLPGLQAGWFEENELYQQVFTVTPAGNRMGVRLRGTPLSMPVREMVSEPVCPGAIQVTPDGQCIVLGIDGQTIGGYPKIAQVIQADLDALGQLRPGQAIAFRKVTLQEAIAFDRDAAAELRNWTLRLRSSLDAFPSERTLPTV